MRVAKPAQFGAAVQERAASSPTAATGPRSAKGVALPRIERSAERRTRSATSTSASQIDRARRTATLTVKAPAGAQPGDIAGIEAAGAAWWPLAMARQLDDAILNLRTNELDIGTWLLKTEGDAAAVLACDRTLRAARRTTGSCARRIGLLRRTLARLDVSSRTLFALIEPGSCFAGTLAELAFAADRTYMLALPDDAARAPKLTLVDANFGAYPMVNDQSRLARRFYDEAEPLARSARGDRQARSMPTRRSRSAWSPRRPTTSTGPTRSASRSRSARRCRPTR